MIVFNPAGVSYYLNQKYTPIFLKLKEAKEAFNLKKGLNALLK